MNDYKGNPRGTKKISRYKFVYWSKHHGYFIARFFKYGSKYECSFKDDKEAAKNIDIFIIKNNFPEPLQVLTKK